MVNEIIKIIFIFKIKKEKSQKVKKEEGFLYNPRQKKKALVKKYREGKIEKEYKN